MIERIELTFFRVDDEERDSKVIVACDLDEHDLMVEFMQSYGLTHGYTTHLD